MGAAARSILRIRVPRAPTWQTVGRRLLALAVVFLALAAAYFLWFRDSSFVQVQDVSVIGAEGDPAVETALASAGGRLSTLHLDVGALEAAVADDPNVASISAEAEFPSGLTIDVDLREPAGYVEADGGAVVASDGVVLATGLERPDGLALIKTEPTTLAERADGATLNVAQVLGAAPEELAAQVESGRVDPDYGPAVTLVGGVELRFGDTTRADLKWLAVGAVIADPDFSGAAYLDLSVPSRPVAG